MLFEFYLDAQQLLGLQPPHPVEHLHGFRTGFRDRFQGQGVRVCLEGLLVLGDLVDGETGGEREREG